MRSRSILVLLLALAVTVAVACSGGGSSDAPTPTPSGTLTPTPSATGTATATATPATMRGAIEVLDESDLDPSAASAGGVQGGRVSASFRDLTQDGGTVLFGTGAIGECTIVGYDATHLPNPVVDAGAIAVRDTSGGLGLLKTVGPCTFQAGFGGYVCISNALVNAGVTAAPVATPQGLVDYVFQTGTFNGETLVGSSVMVNGFTNAHFNSAAGLFPIVAQPDGSSIEALDPAAASDTPEIKASGVNAYVLNGVGPVPAAGSAADFLGGASGAVYVSKADSAVWPAIGFTAITRGDGMDLDDASALPQSFPTSVASAQSYSCAGTNGSCGADGTTSATKMMKLEGRVTKEDTSAILPWQMPAQPAGSEFLEFSCSAVAADSITMPQAAVQTILDWNAGQARRIEMRVLRVAGTELTDGPNTTEIVVGHALVGHTDF